MIFITKLELKNFQSHENTTLEFHRGLNVIVGNSDSGKTAILRAIKWALYNEPLGDYFIKQGEKDVSVTIYFNTKAIVRRYRSSSKNTYYLKKSDGEEYTFDGFGQKVPKEIIDEIEMDKINLDEKSTSIINIAEQLEGPFLLNEKSSLRASAIGRLVGVNYIDDALRETIRDKKQITSKAKDLYLEKKALEKDLKEFEYLDKAESDLNKLKELRKTIDKKQDRLNKITLLNKNFKNIKENILVNEKIYNKYLDIDKMSQKIYSLELNLNKLKLYEKYNKDILLNNIAINENNNIVNKFENLKELDLNIIEVEEKLKKYSKYSILYKGFYQSEKEIEKSKRSIENYVYLDDLYKNYNNLRESIIVYEKFQKLMENFIYIKKRIDDGNKFLKDLSYRDNLEKDIRDIYEKNSKLKILNNYLLEYKDISFKINKKNSELKTLDSNIDRDINTYNNFLLNLGYCPFCGSKVDTHTVEHMNKHFLG